MRCIAHVNRLSATSYCNNLIEECLNTYYSLHKYEFAKIFVFYNVKLLSKLLYLLMLIA